MQGPMTEAVLSHRSPPFSSLPFSPCFFFSSPSSPLPRRQQHQLPRWHWHCFVLLHIASHCLTLVHIAVPHFTFHILHSTSPRVTTMVRPARTTPTVHETSTPDTQQPGSLGTNKRPLEDELDRIEVEKARLELDRQR